MSPIAARLSALALVFPAALGAQAFQRSSDTTTTESAKAVARLDFSGMLFANYQYRADDAGRAANKFDIERAYLTFRIPAGQRLSVRITTDVFQQTSTGNDSYYRGWSIRAKFAYLQYNYLNGGDWQSSARVGLLQGVFIEHDELFWPRWISPSPTDLAAYTPSADAGIANTLNFPRKLGQLYATVTNGPGYTSRETDRFKDFGARVTLTPWGRIKSSPLSGIALTAWGYKGATASRFVNGGAGQTGRVDAGLDRDRWGLHVGSIQPMFTFGAEYASRHEDEEFGENTLASPRIVADSSGNLLSAYATMRPFTKRSAPLHPFSLVARYDRVNTNTDKDNKYEVIIGGVIWDLSDQVSASVDYQANSPLKGSTIAGNHTWFAHFVARF